MKGGKRRLKVGDRVEDTEHGQGTVMAEKDQFGYTAVRFDSGAQHRIYDYQLELLARGDPSGRSERSDDV